MKKMKKIARITALVLSAAMLMSFTGCGGENNNNGKKETAAPTEEPIAEEDKEKSPEERKEEDSMIDFKAELIISEEQTFESRHVSDKLTDNGKAAAEAAKNAISAMMFDEAKVTYNVMKKSQLSYGNSAKVAELMRKSINGEKITIGILGDSIPAGTGASSVSASLGGQIYDFWNECFHPVGKEGNAEYVNASIGSNSLLNVAHRMDDDLLSHKPDLVIFTSWIYHNATYDKAAYESMLVRLLQSGCAVISTIVCADNGANNTAGFKKIADYYGVPIVSWAEAFSKAKFKVADFCADSIHPNDRGHAGIAASVCLYLLGVSENLPEISSKESEMPENELSKQGRLFVNATLYDRNDSDKYTIESLGGFTDGSLALSSFRTYDGWTAPAGAEPIVFTLENISSFMVLYANRTNTGNFNITVENAETGKKLTGWAVNSSSTYDYSWNTDVLKGIEDTKIRVTITPREETMILGLMVTPIS